MIVEFIGAAGVGKSFLSERVLQELQLRGVDAACFDTIGIEKANPRNIALLVHTVYLSGLTQPKSLMDLSRAFRLISRYGVRRVLCRYLPGIHITSEGLFHRIISLQRGSRGLTMVELADRLFRRIQPPDVVVVVETDAQTIFSRRSARNRENDLFTPESVKDDVAMVKASLDAMHHVQRTLHHGMQILRVDAAEEGGNGNVARVADALQRMAADVDNVVAAGA